MHYTPDLYTKLVITPTSIPTGVVDANGIEVRKSTSAEGYSLKLGYFTDAYGDKGSVQAYSNSTFSTLLLNPLGGSVGIGTTTPASSLHLLGSATVEARVESSGNTGGILGFKNLSGSMSIGMSEISAQNTFLLKDRINSQVAYSYTGGSSGGHVWYQNGSEAVRIDSGRRLLIGTTVARTVSTYGTPGLQNESTSSQNSSALLLANTNTSSSPALVIAKSRGPSNGSLTAVQSGDSLGVVQFQGADGFQLLTGAKISAEVDGSPGSNDMPTRLVFSTTADGGSSPTDRMKIDSSGKLYVYADAYFSSDMYFTGTGQLDLPSGTTGQRSSSPVPGMIRFNTTVNQFEGYNGTSWGQLGAGATGGGPDTVFVETGNTVTTDYTITSGKNAITAGPVTVNYGVTVTVGSGQSWVIV